jgi:membrane-associated phospholipid phosphatase
MNFTDAFSRSLRTAVSFSALIAILGSPNPTGAQDLADNLLLPPVEEAAAPIVPPPISPPAITADDNGFDLEGWRNLVPDLASEQRKIWLFPFSASTGKHLKATAVIVGATAGLVALDGYSARFAQKKRAKYFGGFNKVFSGSNTGLSTIYVPLGLYGIGLIRRDAYAQRTFLLAGQAVLNSEILTSVMKDISRRANPADIPQGGNFSDTWFKKKPRAYIAGTGSFPSGHTIAAFSVATVYAERYPGRWQKVLSYGLASVVGFSRVSLESHYVSEVALGAVLGKIFGHYVVQRQNP